MARFDRTIEPGGSGSITLEIRTQGFQGEVSKTAQVYSNDPKNPRMTIGLKGKVWAPVSIKPRYVRLRGTEDDEIKGVVHVKGEKEEPFTLKVVSAAPPEKVEVELRETEKGRTYEIEVKNKAPGQARYTGNVKLTTNYPEKPEIVIQISADIRGRLEVRPKILNFGRMSQKRLEELKKNQKGMTRSVSVILNKGGNLKVEKVEMEKSLFKASTEPIKPGQLVRITVEPIYEKLVKGANLDRLKIYTNQKDSQVLEVPMRFDLL